MLFHESRFVALVSVGLGLAAIVACEETTSPTAADAPDGGGFAVDASQRDGQGPVTSTCAPPTGEGTKHHTGSLASDDERWTATDSPHIIDYSLTIAEGKKLTIEPCAIVRITKNTGVYVRGKLFAEGAADKQIRIERADAADPWTVIEASPTSELRFAYASIEGGGFSNGSALDTFGMIDVRGEQEEPTQGRLHADHLTLKGSASLGLLLREGGGLAATSKDLTITGSGSHPIGSWARASGSIPTGVYTGNQRDTILLEGLGVRDAILEDMTLANRGVPYYVKGSEIGVGAATGTTKATLTIEAGVTMRFAKNSRLLMDSSTSNGPANGVLRAMGTAAQPIVFTSAEASPAAGDWAGILFEGQPDANDRIDHARISYAGGETGISSHDCPSPANPGFTNQGAIVVYGGKPASAFITNTVIESSAADGIVRGWTGDLVDLLPSNTFSGIAQCNQTYPKPTVGVCPASPPCPKN